jgi:cysteine-rich repeat protein
MKTIMQCAAVAAALVAMSGGQVLAQSKCSSAKVKEAGKRADGKLKCHSKAVGKGVAVDGACLGKIETKFSSAWTKAESKGDCLSAGDIGAIEDKVDALVDDLNSALGGTGPSKCSSAKLKESGKKVAGKTKCHAKAVGKGVAVDSACLGKVETKFEAGFAKAEAKEDCLSTGDAGATETAIDAFLDDLLAELSPPPTTTTTTMPGPVCGNGTQEAGESCDDGNTSNNDSCPADCTIDACTPIASSDRQVSVNFAPPVGTGVAGIRVLLDYPEGKVSIPGSGGSVPAGIVTNFPPGASGPPNDLDHALRQLVANTSNMPPGLLFRVHFEDCQGAPAPTVGEFTCTVIDASDQDGNDVAGVTCSVTIP